MSATIRQWLEGLGLGQYGDRFVADDIDLEILPSLSEDDLEKLGVSMGHRKRLLKAMAALSTGPTASAPAPSPVGAEARKVVTVVFADLIGSTTLHERLDAESVTRSMERYYRAMRGAVDAHGGTVVKLMGDGVMAAFGVPRVAEDDALRAVQAGVAMQAAFQTLVREEGAALGSVGLRVGINTGEVVVSADDADVVGDPVNVAARLQAEAENGQVVIGEATRRLVAARVTLAPLGSVALKGRAETIKAYRVDSLDRPVATTAAAFVGRDDELARITAVYEVARATPATRLAVLLGSPGLGKSRLIEEVTQRLAGEARIVTAHCDAAGGATFAPLAAALRELFCIKAGASPEADQETIAAAIPLAEPERARIAAGIAALLGGSPASPEETFFVVRRLLAGLAVGGPVILVIDDLHWAEPLLLDLVEHLVQWGSGTPLFVLLGARPELRDLRSSLATPGGLVSEVVTLSGLDAGAAMRLAANVIGAADLPAAVAAKVLATSEGNPLFVGELVRMLVDEGAIERQGERWIVGTNLAAFEMPPTIHALLAARIERLRPEERTVLERAAVVGRHFSRSAVAALLGRNGSGLDARLEALQRAELIERDMGWLLGEPMLRFHHVLIRDAAYRRLLKGTRAELHEQLADWIEVQGGDAPEHDEIIGRHLEQAHQLRRELGPLDAKGTTLGERAAARLAAAGRRALARDDLPVAAGLLGRALDRLPVEAAARAELALDWCEALLAGGDVATAERALGELGRFTRDVPRLAAWHTCFTGQLTVLTAPDALHAAADVVASAAAELATLDDAAGEAKGHFVHALALARLGRIGGCEAALDQALAAARRAGDRRRANTVLAVAPLAALWGPSPVTRASGRCLDVVRVLRITQGAPAVESVALGCQAVLEALRGRTDAARRMLASSRKMVEDLGITHRLLEADVFGGFIDLLEGDASAAERALRRAYDGLRALGLGIDAARAAALLARALLAQDRGGEAEALSHESEALAGDDLKAAIAWRGVRAEALARRGEHVAAVELAQAAVEIAAATDALLDHADARLALAAALHAAGRGRDADAAERRAIELWEAKGAVLLIERTRRSEARVRATAPAPRPPTAPAPRRRITPNTASQAVVALNAAMAVPDFVALREQVSATYEEIDHPTGVSYGHDATFAALERLMRSRNASCRHEPLATLGDSLVLSRRRVHASATGGGRFDVGEYEQEAYTILEVDTRGRFCRHEVFAADRLHDARVRLFARYAELLPDGPERTRAAAAARSLEIFRRSENDPDILTAALAPDFEGVDHRHLSSHSLRGAAAYVEHLRGWRQVADGLVFRERDILALEPDAMLVATLHTGTARSGGGAYERPFLTLFVIDGEGRLVRAEWFDAGREAEALARFDALAAEAAPRPTVRRRVTPSAATGAIERFGAAVAARDLDALADLLCDDVESVHHGTGLTYGRKGFLTTWRSMFRAEKMTRRQETLASLGDALVLGRHTIQLEGFREAHLAALGPVEVGEVVLFEVDDHGRARRIDMFPAEKLGDAVARLYRRHTERLPEGPERARAAATAASFAVFQDANPDPEQVVGALAPDFESVDHRHLSSWSLRGGDAYLAHLRALREVADDIEFRHLDLLAASPNAQLLRVLHTGTDRAGGGRYERPFLRLFVANADGCIARAEWFDDEREAEALARFDELTAGAAPPSTARRHPVPNAATRSAALFDEAFASRDPTALETLFRGSAVTVVDHPTECTYGAEGAVDSYRRLQRMDGPVVRHEPLAALGDALGLFRRRISAAGAGGRFDVGVFEREELVVLEPDVAIEIFAADRLGDALVRLYERHAELRPEGAEKTRVAGIARNLATWNGPLDLERIRAAYAPSTRVLDHRVFGTWAARDVDEALRHYRLQLDLAPDFAARFDDVLAADAHAMVARMTFFGTARDSGGPFENAVCVTMAFGDDGRTSQSDVFEAEQADEALARYDELARASEAPERFANAVTRMADRFVRATAARDWQGLAALFAQNLRFDDRRPLLRMELLRDGFLEQFRVLFDVPNARWTATPRATRGERLALFRLVLHGDAADDGGPIEIDHLWVGGVDDDGCCDTIVLFEPSDLDAAYAELDARYALGEPADPEQVDQALARFAQLAASSAAPAGSLAQPTAATLAFERLMRRFDARDWDALRAACSRRFTWEDRRPIVGLSGDVELMIASARERTASGASHERREIIGTAGERVAIARILWAGGPADGRFEVEFLAVHEVDADGLCAALLFFDPADLRVAQREAWARWAAIDPSVAEVTANLGAVLDAWNAQDLDRLRVLLADDLVAEDHRRTGIGRSEGREAYLRSVAALWELAPESRLEAGLVWLALEPHMGLHLCRRTGMLPDGGEFASDFLVLAVVERGLMTRLEVFETHAADAALVRFAELRPDPLRIPPNAVTRTWERWCTAAAAADQDTIAALYHPSYRSEDRRRLIRVTTDRAGMLENDRFLAEVGWQPTRTLLATAGDRLALQHVLWRTGGPGSESEVEVLQLSEVDGDGRFLWSTTFDLDDRAAAFRELGYRYLGTTRPSAIARLDSLRDAGGDLVRLRAALPDDFFFHDHRRTGLGRLEGADAYVQSVAALRELAPDATVGQPLHFLADEPHGALSIAHSFGTLASGGAFESVYAMITLYGPDGMSGAELFELGDLDAAKARFAELRATTTG